jgi:NAD(P)-dependent dehydrogenase (short-subunit alcohol dehydrogenase family)
MPGEGGVEVLLLDLAELASVRIAANTLLDAGAPIDVLLNNAGVMATPQMQTKDGYEYQLGGELRSTRCRGVL